MPFVFPAENHCNNDTVTAFERFNQIVENYKHIIENNATARCMVGFTAASFIRNEGDIDIDSVESWLQSLASDTDTEQTTSLDEEQDKVSRILNVVKETSVQYYAQGYDEEIAEDSNTDDSEDNEDDEFTNTNEAVYELNRFISCDPYSSNDSHPTFNYIPKYTFVNYSTDNVIIPLEEVSRTSFC